VVGVAENDLHAFCDSAADRTFSGAHHSDQCYRTRQVPHEYRITRVALWLPEGTCTGIANSARNILWLRGVRMRSSMARSEGMGWGSWLLILVVVLIVGSGIALTIYGGTVTPQQHQVEQVLSNDRFPR
jgi:hypothetical protein